MNKQSTENYISNLPHKSPVSNVDVCGFMESLDPATLDSEYQRFYSQRDFAKLIGYLTNKITDSEKGKMIPEDSFLEKLVLICYAKPNWLFD